MKQAAVGFRVHSGWSALVLVSLEKGTPEVLSRQRVQLVETFSYKFRQPYHTAEKMPLEKAREFISGALSEARRLGYRALRSLQADLEKQGYQLKRCGLLLASGRGLPSLEKILQSHALIHTADGELFRDALRHSCARCGLEIVCTKEKGLLDQGVQTIGVSRDELPRRLTELGRALGSPWTQDEKFAALAAWLALVITREGSREQE
jgi:hypothetical protein